MNNKRRSGRGHTALHAYLNDHLAGATGALDLLDRMIRHAGTPDERRMLTELCADVSQDRATLERLLDVSGARTSALRTAGGWMVEKAGRLKLLLDDPGRGSLGHLEQFEMLALGILGKRALWQALLAAHLPEFDDVDFAALETRADEQYQRVEERRIASARRVLGDAPVGAAAGPAAPHTPGG
jgi:hypothetical protein